jgi:hypothetical protein
MSKFLQRPYWKRGGKDDGSGPEMSMLKNKAMSLAKDLEVSSSINHGIFSCGQMCFSQLPLYYFTHSDDCSYYLFTSNFFQNLLKLHERQETVVADLRAKLRHLRQDATTKDKKLELAHRTIERLSVDKHGLEAGDAAKKTYIRQLESRVTGMKSTSELELFCGQLQAEIQSLRSQIQISQEKANAAEDLAAEHQAETQYLRRGIQLAAEQLARSSGADISASMLLAVAQGQNEAVELSSQLAEAQGQVDEMAGALTAARTHLQAQHDALKQWQRWETTQSQQAAEREEALKTANEVSKRLIQQVEMLQAAVHEARRERDAARHGLELEKTARQDSEERTRGLQLALRQSEQNEITLRAEIQRLVVAGNNSTSRPTSGAAAPVVASARTAGAGTSLPPTRPQSGAAAGKFSPAVRYPLDASIAALERELAQMAANPALGPPAAASTFSPLRQQQQQFSSPQRRIQETGGTWHTNPLAEAETSPEQQQKQVPSAAPSAAHSLTESAAWRVLERGFDQQRAEDRRMNAFWQQQNHEEEDAQVVTGFAEESEEQEEESSAAAISLAGPSSSSANNNINHNLRVELPSDAGTAGNAQFTVTSPGIASNTGPTTTGIVLPLPSPDFQGQFAARASADWLNGSIGDGFKQLEEDIKQKSTSGNGSRGVTVHAFAGVPPVVQQQQQPAVAEKPPARQSLFDLAKMELKY